MTKRTALIWVSAFVVMSLFFASMTWRLLSGSGVGETHSYRALFTDVSALAAGDDVRIAGVTVGKVRAVTLDEQHRAVVEFTTDTEQSLTDQTRAEVRYKNLTGNRYLALTRGIAPPPRANGSAQGVRTASMASSTRGTPLSPGATIPVNRTSGALDLDNLFGGFQPLFEALTPDQVNRLSNDLVQLLQGEGSTVLAIMRDIADFTSTLAARDAVIGQVITNLNTVLTSMSEQRAEFGLALQRAQQLATGLASQRKQIAAGLDATGQLTGELAVTLRQVRPELSQTSDQLGRLSALMTTPQTSQGITKRISSMPRVYTLLSGVGGYGNFTNFYMCGLGLQFTGLGGEDVDLPIATLPDKRCRV